MKNYQVFLFYRGPQKECKNEFSQLVPIGLFNILYYLLKNGIEAKLYNLSGFSEKKLENFIKEVKPGISFISSFYGNHWEALKVSQYIKKYNDDAKVVLGGPLSVIGDEILKRFDTIDFVVYGEGEISSLKLISLFSGKDISLANIPNLFYRNNTDIIKTSTYYHKDIDDFFFVPSEIKDYTHFVDRENFEVIISSRGCPFSCSFCSSPVLWERKLRFHSIRNIIKYIKDLRKTFGSLYFSIRDDNFLANKKRVIQLSKEMIREKLFFIFNLQGSAKFIDEETLHSLSFPGCNQIQIGIESLSPKILNFFNKKIDIKLLNEQIKLLRKYCIEPFGYFITGVNESEEDLTPTLEFIKKSGITTGVLSPLVIYPGTELVKNISAKDFFADDREIMYYSKSSYEKNKKKFYNAFKVANGNFFTSEEISYRDDGLSRILAKVQYLINSEKVFEAIDFVENWVKKEPKNPLLLFSLVELYLNQANHTKAKSYLLKLDKLLDKKNQMVGKLLDELNL